MIASVHSHSLYPAGYHCDPRQPLPYAALASQKNHMAFYLCTVYGNPSTRDWFCKAYKATGKKLNMGKSCVRFKKLDDLPLEVIGRLMARTPVRNYVAYIEKTLLEHKAAKPRARKPAQ